MCQGGEELGSGNRDHEDSLVTVLEENGFLRMEEGMSGSHGLHPVAPVLPIAPLLFLLPAALPPPAASVLCRLVGREGQ